VNALRSPLFAAGLAVALALGVAAAWYCRVPPGPLTAAEGTIALRVTRHHDAIPARAHDVRDRATVQAILRALDVDAQPVIACPADYSTAAIGLVLVGRDAYARRNAYVWDLDREPRVVVVNSAGCRGGPVPAPEALTRLLLREDGGT
jgi:hypothetical protein